MATEISRIPIAEFSRHAARLVEQIATAGGSLEVAWPDGRVALVRQGRVNRREEASARLEPERPITKSAQLRLPSARLIAQRRAAIARLDRLREEIAHAHPGVVFDAVADINAAREERLTELDRR